jgi:hypothetical protein
MANRKRRPGGNPARIAASTRRPAAGPAGARRTPRPQSWRARTPAGAGSEPALRAWVIARSRGPLLVLSRQPKWLVPAIMVILVLVGLAAPVPYAVVALALLVAFVGWLAFLSWPVLATAHRALRLFVLAVMVAVAVARATGALA